MIPEPNKTIPDSLQKSSPLFILCLLVSMLAAIKFNNQPMFMADKIGNIVPDRYLTSKFIPWESTGTQLGPNEIFRVCLIFAQLACSLVVHSLSQGQTPH